MIRPARFHDPGQHTKTWLCRFVSHSQLTLTMLATTLHVSIQSVHYWLNPNMPHQFPACLVPAWTRAYGPRLIAYLCHQCGGWFQPYPQATEPTPADTLSAALDVTQASTGFARTFLDTMAHTPLTYTDLDAIADAHQQVSQATTHALWLAKAAQAPEERDCA